MTEDEESAALGRLQTPPCDPPYHTRAEASPQARSAPKPKANRAG